MFKKIILGCSLGLILTGCQTAYYSAMEQVGVHKRDILLDRVDNAKDAQQDAQQQFKDALEQYRAVVRFDGGELDSLYTRLQSEYDDSVAAADNVRNRIDRVEDVADALFKEWQQELEQYKNQSLRNKSAKQLRDTKRRYRQLLVSMKRAEKRMEPVLTALNDNVLYLKHNLNARAVGALKGELVGIRKNVDILLKEMQAAIQESDRFIESLDRSK